MTIGWSENLICFQNISTSFDFNWINAPFDATETEKPEIVKFDEILDLNSTDSWKTIELDRLATEEYEYYGAQLKAMNENLNRIKSTVISYIDSNELELRDDQFPMQFFNLNATEVDIQSGALKDQIELKRELLQQTFFNEKSRIENIKQMMWDCFDTKLQKLQGVFTDIFIENFPLTALDEKLGDETILNELLKNEQIFRQICKWKPWIHPNLTIEEEITWPVVEIQAHKTIDRFSNFASKIIDQQLNANVNLDLNFFSALPIETENVDISNETIVNTYNLKVYVSIFHPLFRVEYILMDIFEFISII